MMILRIRFFEIEKKGFNFLHFQRKGAFDFNVTGGVSNKQTLISEDVSDVQSRVIKERAGNLRCRIRTIFVGFGDPMLDLAFFVQAVRV